MQKVTQQGGKKRENNFSEKNEVKKKKGASNSYEIPNTKQCIEN